MSKAYEFLKQCGTFFVTTINGSVPAARPFGAVMEYRGELYISTANTKDVQMLKFFLLLFLSRKRRVLKKFLYI